MNNKKTLLKDFLNDRNHKFVSSRNFKRSILSKTGSTAYVLTSYKSTLDLGRAIFTLARNRLVSLGVAHLVRLKVSKKKNVTDGKNLLISSEVLNHKLPVNKKASVILGETTHEAAHVMYSNFEDAGKAHKLGGKVLKSILNIVEDERIERKIGWDYPGYTENLADIKEFYFKIKPDADNDSASLLDSFLGFVRYPDMLPDIIEDDTFDVLMKCKELLIFYPKTAQEAYDVSVEIFEMFKNEDENFEDDAEDYANKLNKVLDSSTSVGSSKEVDESDMSHLDEMVWNEEAEMIEGDSSIFKNVENNEYNYKNIKNRVLPHVGPLSRFMRLDMHKRVIELKGLRSGSLDTNKLVEAVQGVSTIYTRKIEQVSQRVNVVLLIDESGSMTGEPIERTKEVAILMVEALKKVRNVDLYVYGHTTVSQRSLIHVYKENKKDNLYSLGNAEADACNRDGEAIRSVAKKVRKLTKEPSIMFVVSDGAPSDSGYSGSAAITDTRNAVKEVTKQNFLPIQIAIDSHCDPKTMFDHYVEFDDLGQMVSGVGALLRKKLKTLV